MKRIKVLQVQFDKPALLEGIGDVLGIYDISIITLAMNKSTMYKIRDIENQDGIFITNNTSSKYCGCNILQNDEIPFGEVKIMIEVA